MKYYSLNGQSAAVSFATAATSGQAPDGGLYFPERLPQHVNFAERVKHMSLPAIAYELLWPYVEENVSSGQLKQMVEETFSFPIPLMKLNDHVQVLELFYGPTLAFKDVGAGFMSRCLSLLAGERGERIVVLVATSGDTGGAVANSFYGVPNVEVVILYPSGKVSGIQEKQLTTLGKNIHALEVEGNFDDCQQLVKTAFADKELSARVRLTSANSINIARWLPQQVYYAWAWKQWEKEEWPVIVVPSGNFGNLAAGLLAWKAGIPVKHFIAATNANDAVPGYFRTGKKENRKAIATISNAMDVALPNNLVRLEQIFGNDLREIRLMMDAMSVSDEETREMIRQYHQAYHYIADPHTAVGLSAWGRWHERNPADKGIVLGTAHPVKFPDVVEQEIRRAIPYPPAVLDLVHKPSNRQKMPVNGGILKNYLLEL